MPVSSLSKEQGNRIKKPRKSLALSRAAFAKRQANYINVSALQAIEEGRYKNGLSKKTANALVSAFYNEGIIVNLEWLFYGKSTPPRYASAVNLETTRSIKHIFSDEILGATYRNASIMKLNHSLIKAIKSNEITRIKMAMQQGANVHQLKEKDLYSLTGPKQDTCLHVAAEFSSQEIVTFFIKKIKIHPNIRNRNRDSPVHSACYSDNVEALLTLICFNVDLEANSREGATPLTWAAFLGHYDCAKTLLEHGVKIDNTDDYGNIAAH